MVLSPGVSALNKENTGESKDWIIKGNLTTTKDRLQIQEYNSFRTTAYTSETIFTVQKAFPTTVETSKHPTVINNCVPNMM